MKKHFLLIVFTAAIVSACAPNPSVTITSDSISPSPTAINNNGSAGYPWGSSVNKDEVDDANSTWNEVDDDNSTWNDVSTPTIKDIDISRRGASIPGDTVTNNGSIGNPWGPVISENVIDPKRWVFTIGGGSGNRYNYSLIDSENKLNHVDVSTTKVGKNVFIEVKSNLSAKEYILSYARYEDNSIIKNKQENPYFILDNLSSGKYKIWLEIGKNLVNLDSISID